MNIRICQEIKVQKLPPTVICSCSSIKIEDEVEMRFAIIFGKTKRRKREQANKV